MLGRHNAADMAGIYREDARLMLPSAFSFKNTFLKFELKKVFLTLCPKPHISAEASSKISKTFGFWKVL